MSSASETPPTSVGAVVGDPAPSQERAADGLGTQRYVRAGRAAAALLTLAAAVLWLRPINVPGANLQPFGCGSPAAPTSNDLARLVCEGSVGVYRGMSLGLLLSAVLVLAVGELLGPRLPRRVPALPWALLPAVPLLVLGVTSLLLPLVAHSADGAKFRCGTAVSPNRDVFAQGQCGQLADARTATGAGIVLTALLALAATAYIASAGGSRPPRARGDDARAGGPP